MSFEIGLALAAVLFLILLCAFFNACQTSLRATARAHMQALEQEGNVAARRVNRLLAVPDQVRIAILVGNTVTVVLASAIAAAVAYQHMGPLGVLAAAAVVGLAVILVGIALPKAYAIAHPDRAALALAPLLRGIVTVLSPVTRLLERPAGAVTAAAHATLREADAPSALASREEIRDAIQLETEEGTVARHDAAMLGGVLDLSRLRVGDIMVHRTKMETVNGGDQPALIIDEVMRSQFTRVPVWRTTSENIVGILHSKDLLAALHQAEWNVDRLDITTFTTTPWYVPDTTTLKDQLNAFLKRKAQIAMVIDEYGEVQGLITLEDILEEIVGQIADEHDDAQTQIRPQPDGTINVDGTVPVRDLNRHMGWELPDHEATTIAGLVIHEAQMIPEPGQTFSFHGYRFEILRKSRNKIGAIRINRLPPEETPHDPADPDHTRAAPAGMALASFVSWR